MSRVVVVGGGISGLACAHHLFELKKENGSDLEIILLEAGPRLGGTLETQKKDGFILESGPDAFISEKPAALELCRRLGMEGRLIETESLNRKSYLARDKKLIPIPEGFYLTAPTKLAPFLASPLLSVSGRFRAAMEPWLKSAPPRQEESVGSFIRRRFGNEMLERVGQAMLAGIYTADPETLSLKAALPRFAELEAKYGSVTRGLREEAHKKDSALKKVRGPRYSLFMSLKDGMQDLTDTLAKKLPSESVRRGFAVKKLSFDPNLKKWSLVSERGENLSADQVCLAVPPQTAAVLSAGLDADMSRELADTLSESVVTINLAYLDEDFPKRPQGFGFVVPASEQRALIACSFSSNKFPGRAPKGFHLLRAFVGGVFGKEFYALSDADMLRAVRRDLEEILGVRNEPIFSSLKRHPRSVVQYRLGHLDRIGRIRSACEKQSGFFVTGAAYRGVGIPDCVEDAQHQAEQIFKRGQNA